MSNENNRELSSLLVKQEKLVKFKQWCDDNQVDYTVIIEKFIDACLTENKLIISLFQEKKNNLNFQEEIQTYIDKSLLPLIIRIEQLESQINQSTTSTAPAPKLHQPSETTSTISEDTDKRIYLPRQEVWQRLKQTEYIKYSGYDSFLRARSDEFIQYGIFFDSDKKRFYIIDE